MNIPKISVDRPVAATMLLAAVAFLGVGSLLTLNVDLFPNIEIPLAFIQTPYPGVDPAEMENIVTRKIEQEVNTVENIKRVTSTSFEGYSWISVEFNWGTNIDLAAVDLREKVDIAKRELPRDIEQVTVAKLDINAQPVLDVSLGGDYDLKALRQLADKEIRPAFERVGGVANVEVLGGREREIRVKVFPEKLRAMNLTINDVIKAISTDNQNTSVGNITEGNFRYLIRSEGESPSPQALGNIIIKEMQGRPVYLSELARVEDSFKDVESVSRLDGKPAVTLSIKREADANPVLLSDEVKKLIPKIEAKYLGKLKITIGNDRSDFIRDSIEMVKSNARDGSILAIIVLFIFLKNLRSTAIIGLSIPLAVIMTFPFMLLKKGMTLNLMTLGGLALGVGMMVDNSIVVLENTFRFFMERKDRDRKTNAVDAANEVMLPIFASTMTTVVVFVPIGFVPGFVGEIFINMSLTIVYALLASMLVAVTTVPMLCSRFLNVEPVPMMILAKSVYKGLYDTFLASRRWVFTLLGSGALLGAVLYLKPEQVPILLKVVGGVLAFPLVLALTVDLVMFVLKNTLFLVFDTLFEFLRKVYVVFLGLIVSRWYTRLPYFVGTLAVFWISLKFFPAMEFFPQMDRGIFVITVETPEGTSIENTDAITARIEGLTKVVPEVDKILSSTKMGEANITVVLKAKEDRKRTTTEVLTALRPKVQEIPGIRNVTFGEPKMGGHEGGKAVQIEVSGDDYAQIKKICPQVAAAIRDVPGLKDLDDGVRSGRPEVKIEFDREKIKDLGSDLSTIAGMTRAFVYGLLAGKYKELNEEYDIRVEAADDYKNEIEKLKKLELTLEKDKIVNLSQIARVYEEKGFTKIERKNLKRVIKVQADIEKRPLQAVILDIQEKLKGFKLPPGYEINMGGEEEERMEAFKNLFIALFASIALVYMIMAAQFESFVYPFIIMFTMPLSIIGVVLSLRLSGFALSITAMIGIIMLGGIVVNNGIILVEFINQRRQELGETKIEACVRSGDIRLRPILMTVLTTLLGMFPLALGIGAGSDFYQPLAITVIGGLTVSTILTLTFIPVTYILLDDITELFMGFIGKFI